MSSPISPPITRCSLSSSSSSAASAACSGALRRRPSSSACRRRWRACRAAVAQIRVQLRPADPRAAAAAARPVRPAGHEHDSLGLAAIPRRARVLRPRAGVLLAAPWLVNGYVLSVMIIVIYVAYIGQAWNIMMGFAGLLSIGHALYFGIGAYAGAVLFDPFRRLALARHDRGRRAGGAGRRASSARSASAFASPASISRCSPSPSPSSTRILLDNFAYIGASGGSSCRLGDPHAFDLWICAARR